jgi:hypothetical protein
MPATERRYCCVGVHWADAPDSPEILMVEGKVVVFDTLPLAREVIPRLFSGRQHAWDATQEVLFALELSRTGFNRLSIFTGYDPYDVPGGMRSKGVWSEAEGRDWRYHVYWNHELDVLLSWADTMENERLLRLQELAGV